MLYHILPVPTFWGPPKICQDYFNSNQLATTQATTTTTATATTATATAASKIILGSQILGKNLSPLFLFAFERGSVRMKKNSTRSLVRVKRSAPNNNSPGKNIKQ